MYYHRFGFTPKREIAFPKMEVLFLLHMFEENPVPFREKKFEVHL